MTQQVSRTGVENERGYQCWRMRDEAVNSVSWGSTSTDLCSASLDVEQRRDGRLQIVAIEATKKTTRRVSILLQREAAKSLLEYLSEWQEMNKPKTNGNAPFVAELSQAD